MKPVFPGWVQSQKCFQIASDFRSWVDLRAWFVAVVVLLVLGPSLHPCPHAQFDFDAVDAEPDVDVDNQDELEATLSVE